MRPKLPGAMPAVRWSTAPGHLQASRRLTTGALTLVAVGACALGACEQRPERPQAVGRRRVLFEDADRSRFIGTGARPLATTIWYPTSSHPEEPWRVGMFRAGWAVYDGALPEPARPRPTVLLSHGTGGAAAQLSWLAEALASRGYLAVAVDHHGNTAAEPEYAPQGFALWWERPRDLTVVLDEILADDELAPHVDVDRIGAAGFSLGGYTVLALAGVRVSPERHEAFCREHDDDPACRLPPEAPFERTDIERLSEENEMFAASLERADASYRDPRVRAIFALAPVLRPAMDPASFDEVEVPVEIVVGSLDRQASAEQDVEPLAARLASARLHVLPEVGHYTFLARCTLAGHVWLRTLCTEPGSVRRRDVHAEVAQRAVAFFDAQLGRPRGSGS